MGHLLEFVGFEVNERMRRCACILHGGSNPTAFSWTEGGLWRCHSCGQGGDRITLVRTIKHCSFSEAICFLAELAGVEYRREVRSNTAVEQAKHDWQSLRSDAELLISAYKKAWREAQNTILQLERIRRSAGNRLDAIHRGAKERWLCEAESCGKRWPKSTGKCL